MHVRPFGSWNRRRGVVIVGDFDMGKESSGVAWPVGDGMGK